MGAASSATGTNGAGGSRRAGVGTLLAVAVGAVGAVVAI
jgi:hypothetical protein